MSNYIHNSQANKDKGSASEKEFAEFFKDKIVRKSTTQEDMVLHFDYVVNAGETELRTVDVKSGNKNPGILRVEITNRMGKKGWGFGQADYIVYNQETEWIWVKRTELIKTLEEHTTKERGQFGSLYRYWFQKGSQAVLSFVNIHDIKKGVIIVGK